MNITTSSFRRIAAIAGATTITCITAITTTSAAQPAPATDEPERPCFITQPRWNTAIDGPAPTCPTPRGSRRAPPAPSTRNRIDFGDEYAAPPRSKAPRGRRGGRASVATPGPVGPLTHVTGPPSRPSLS